MLTTPALEEKELHDLNQRIINGETCCIDDRDGVGYMLNAIIEVLPPQVRSVTFQGITVTRNGEEDWTFRRALRYITKHCL